MTPATQQDVEPLYRQTMRELGEQRLAECGEVVFSPARDLREIFLLAYNMGMLRQHVGDARKRRLDERMMESDLAQELGWR